MIYLVAGLILVGAIGMINLLLIFAVIRRLREHTQLLTESTKPDFGDSVPGVGDRPDPFQAHDIDGTPVDRPRLIAFFSTGCTACETQLPAFVRHAAALADRDLTLAVVTGDHSEVDAFVQALAPVARVVVETADAPVSRAFRIGAFPAWCLLDDDGTVLDSGVGLDRLPRLTAA